MMLHILNRDSDTGKWVKFAQIKIPSMTAAVSLMVFIKLLFPGKCRFRTSVKGIEEWRKIE
jgi:hypothetical protein